MSAAARAQWAARGAVRGAAVGGSSGALLGAFGLGLLWGQARIARRTVRPPVENPPLTGGEYGNTGPHVRLAVLGDSSAAGIGAGDPGSAPGHLLARTLAAAGRRVSLRVHAVSGARSADLADQVDAVLADTGLADVPTIAVFSVGANDVTHLVRPDEACADLAAALVRLTAAGCAVVVGTCPDLGTVRPIAHPLRFVARVRSAQLAAAQRRAVETAGGQSVPLGALIGPAFQAEPEVLFCSDRFHPSAAGYRLFAEALAPMVLAAAGCAVPEPEPRPAESPAVPEHVRAVARADARRRLRLPAGGLPPRLRLPARRLPGRRSEPVAAPAPAGPSPARPADLAAPATPAGALAAAPAGDLLDGVS